MYKKIAILLVFIAFIITFRFTGIGEYFTLNNLQEQSASLQAFVEQNYFLAVFMYVFTYIAAIALSLPAAALLSVTGGFLFGTILGALFTNVGATTGSAISFLMVRYLVGEQLQKKYAVQLKEFNKEMQEQGVWYLLMIRFIAVIPFFVANALVALTNVPLTTFIWTTSLGILPSSFVFTYAGQQLHAISSVRDIFSREVLLAFGLLGLLALVPVVIKKWRKK